MFFCMLPVLVARLAVRRESSRSGTARKRALRMRRRRRRAVVASETEQVDTMQDTQIHARPPARSRAYESTRRSGPPAGPSGRLPAGEAVRTLTISPLIWWKSNSHNLVAEPGFEEMDIVLPKSGFFTLYWQQRTGCMPFKTSHEAHVPALHW